MIKATLLFALGLLLLIKGGDYFVDASTSIAQRLHVPDLLIGATVVSIGTTLPEVMVSATSALSGHGEMAYGNAIGSIICNTALIAAITIAVHPSPVEKKSLQIPVFFFFGSAILYIAAALTGSFTRPMGIALLVIFAAYIGYQINEARKANTEEMAGDEDTMSMQKSLILLIVGAAAIALGANLLVNNGTIIAKELGVPESVIALTFIALGTSLPELVTAITALAKGHGALSLGNIIGANLFNLVLVSGVSVTLNPFALPSAKTLFGMNAALLVDAPVMMLVMLILCLPGLIKGKLYRSQGIVLLLIYAAFIAFQFAS